jgi:threonine/homoserine/homoserine lactone efflux protein
VDVAFIDALSKGTVLGLAAGFSPGPLTVLVISETLRHGLRAGMKVSLAPVLTDLPIIALAALLLDRLASRPAALGVIALLGGGFLLHLGIGSLKPPAVAIDAVGPAPRSLLRGVTANLLNPNPYIFWIGVGTPILLTAFGRSWTHAAAFASAFFFFIVGSKLLLARIVDGSRAFLSGGVYRWVLRILGLLLIVYALVFFRDGLARIGLYPYLFPGNP